MSRLVPLIREFGRIPTKAEMRLKSREGYNLPTEKTFRRFGSKEQLIVRVIEFCKNQTDCQDIIDICLELRQSNTQELGKIETEVADPEDTLSFVYLLKSGKHHKIGRSNAVGRREYELAIQLPEKSTVVHKIATDDPTGIETYWHNRFSAKRKNGEWFELSSDEIRIFKRRKFM